MFNVFKRMDVFTAELVASINSLADLEFDESDRSYGLSDIPLEIEDCVPEVPTDLPDTFDIGEFVPVTLPALTVVPSALSPEATYFSRIGMRARNDAVAYVENDSCFCSLEYLRKNSASLEFRGDSVIELELPMCGLDHMSDVSMNYGCLVDGKYVHMRGEGHHIIYGHRECNPDYQVYLIRFRTAVGWRSLLCYPDRAICVTADRCATFEYYDGSLVLTSFDPPLGTNFKFHRAQYWDGIVRPDVIQVYLIDGQQFLAALTPFTCLRAERCDQGTQWVTSEGDIVGTSGTAYNGCYWVRLEIRGEITGCGKYDGRVFRLIQPSRRYYPYTRQMTEANLNKGGLMSFPLVPCLSYVSDFDFRVVDPSLYGYNVRDIVDPMSHFMLRQHKSQGYFYNAFKLVQERVGATLNLRVFFSFLRKASFCCNRGRILPVHHGSSCTVLEKREFLVSVPARWVPFVKCAFDGVVYRHAGSFFVWFRTPYHDMVHVMVRLCAPDCRIYAIP